MLLTVAEFREAIRTDPSALIAELEAATGRSSAEEREAWNASLPALTDALAAPALWPLHLYFGGHGYSRSSIDCQPHHRGCDELCIVLSVNSVLPLVCWAGSVGA